MTTRVLLYGGLPLALIGAAALLARAYDSAWIASGQPVSASQLKATLDELNARIASLEAAQRTEPDCPRGYTKDMAVTTYTVCKNGNDEMVRVGAGAEAFWIDRYEASVWSNRDGTGVQYGATNASGVGTDDYPATFPDNGQRGPAYTDVFAVSKSGAQPSASITWFQAQQACRASGKRLPSDEEWQAAASGTNDPGPNNGSGGACVTQASGPRQAGLGAACISAWGAQDMAGNVGEYTAGWAAAPASVGGPNYQNVTQWAGPEYHDDGLFNVMSATAGLNGWASGNVAAVVRGGYWTLGTSAGVFTILVNRSPQVGDTAVGFRCALAVR